MPALTQSLGAYLLDINAKTQAQAELIALEANLPEDSPLQMTLGSLFLRVQDDEHALAAYRLSLRQHRHNAAALAGAGAAAFQQGLYPAAQRYLQAAVVADPKDAQSAALLRTADAVMQLNPFRPQIGVKQRNRIVVGAYAAAGDRLKACGMLTAANGGKLADVAQQWVRMKPGVTERGLRRDPDTVNDAMQLVFSIEEQTRGQCGGATQADNALLLIAKLHEEN